MPPRGVAQSDWDSAKREAREEMIAAARSPAGTISYSSLATRITALTFEPDSHVFHTLLGEIAREEDVAGRGMLTVVVIHQGADLRPGPGFFKLAQELEKNTLDPEAFWQAEFNRVRIAWARMRPVRPGQPI